MWHDAYRGTLKDSYIALAKYNCLRGISNLVFLNGDTSKNVYMERDILNFQNIVYAAMWSLINVF